MIIEYQASDYGDGPGAASPNDTWSTRISVNLACVTSAHDFYGTTLISIVGRSPTVIKEDYDRFMRSWQAAKRLNGEFANVGVS